MSISLSTPITGGAQTGFTSPTYTIVSDVAPAINGKQWAVTALGGTQAGVTTHTVSDPFTLAFFRPASLRSLPAANPITGIIKNVPNNRYSFIVRKGVLPLTDQARQVALGSVKLDIPAGSETNDPANVRALISALIGALNQLSAGLGDTAVNGVM